MVWYQYVLGVLLILCAVTITVIVLLQESRTSGLSGAIAGGSADTFYGKTKGRTMEAKLERYTKVLAGVFFVLVLAAFLILYFVK